jgi:hypothetical protein
MVETSSATIMFDFVLENDSRDKMNWKDEGKISGGRILTETTTTRVSAYKLCKNQRNMCHYFLGHAFNQQSRRHKKFNQQNQNQQKRRLRFCPLWVAPWTGET